MKITLTAWAASHYDPPPSAWVLRKWVRAGEIRPKPELVGKTYYVEPDAQCGCDAGLARATPARAPAAPAAPRQRRRHAQAVMKTALYRHFDRAGALLYVGVSCSLIARHAAHEANSHWVEDVARIEVEWHANRAAAELAEREAIHAERPRHNITHTRGSRRS